MKPKIESIFVVTTILLLLIKSNGLFAGFLSDQAPLLISKKLASPTRSVLIGTFEFNNFFLDGILKKKLDGGYYKLINGFLRFKFNEEYVNNGTKLEFRIYDKNRTVVISNSTAGVSLNIAYKDNRCSLNVKAVNPNLPSGFYVLEVKDKKGEISMLRFKL